MSLKEERLQILTMLQEGKINADEAATLLSALESGAKKDEQATDAPKKARWLRVRVTDQATGKQRVSVNLPMGLVNVAVKMGAKFAPNLDDMDMQEVVTAVESGMTGKIIDVMDDEDGEHVEIFVE